MNDTQRVRGRKGYKLDTAGIILLVVFIGLAIATAITAFNLIKNLVSGWSITSLPGAPVTGSGSSSNNTTTTGGDTPLQPSGPAAKAWDGKSRINILFFGLDYRECETYFAGSATGCDVNGASRTDSMILFTVDPTTKTAGMLTIPRDLWVDIPGGFGFNKINTAYFFGEGSHAPDGPTLAMQTVQNFLGVPIQYYIRIDFSAFIKVVDELGGVQITPDMDISLKDTSNIIYYFINTNTGEVLQNYTDPVTHKQVLDLMQCSNCLQVGEEANRDTSACPATPLPNSVTCQVESGAQVLNLTKGETYTLNGDQTLAYARNRYIEGEDFARSAHQQQVIMAIKNQITRLDMLPTLIANAPALYTDLSSGIHTNLTLDQALQLAVLVMGMPDNAITQAAITESQVVPKRVTLSTGQAADVLVPIPEEIRIIRDSIFTSGGTTSPMAGNLDQVTKLQGEAAKVQVVNGSNTGGLETRTQSYLQSQGVNVVQTGNASSMSVCEIDVFTSKPYTLAYLANLFGVSSNNIISKYDPGSAVDFVVILGDSWAASNPMQ